MGGAGRMRVARMMMIMTTIMMIMMALMSTMVMVMMFKVMVMITTTIMSMVVIFNNTGTWVDGVMVATITMRIHAARRRKPQSGSARGRLSMQTDDWWTLLYERRPTVQVGNVGTPQSGARCTRRLCGLLTYRRRLGNRESKCQGWTCPCLTQTGVSRT